jgi:hypothetical protein
MAMDKLVYNSQRTRLVAEMSYYWHTGEVLSPVTLLLQFLAARLCISYLPFDLTSGQTKRYQIAILVKNFQMEPPMNLIRGGLVRVPYHLCKYWTSLGRSNIQSNHHFLNGQL